MTGGIFGGGVIFVIAAVLWTAVLVPSWIRRKEFRDTERHALRLQRTLRILAESAEVPHEVRVEATAREALAHEKILRTARLQREAEHASELAQAEADKVRAEILAAEMKRKQATMTRAQKLRRPAVRRIRAIGALIAFLSILGLLVGAGVAIAGQGATVLLISAILFAAAAGLLVLLAPGRVARAVTQPLVAPVVSVTPAEEALPPIAESAVAVEMSEQDSAVAHAQAQAAARDQIDRARALARARAQQTAVYRQNQTESILLKEAVADARAHHAQWATQAAADPAGTTAVPGTANPAAVSRESAGSTTNDGVEKSSAAALQTPAQQAAARAAERYQQMGVVGDTSTGMLDLDAVLRSRRRVG